jgi:hypothetical protein
MGWQYKAALIKQHFIFPLSWIGLVAAEPLK